jgi:hypothetical protein
MLASSKCAPRMGQVMWTTDQMADTAMKKNLATKAICRRMIQGMTEADFHQSRSNQIIRTMFVVFNLLVANDALELPSNSPC